MGIDIALPRYAEWVIHKVDLVRPDRDNPVRVRIVVFDCDVRTFVSVFQRTHP